MSLEIAKYSDSKKQDFIGSVSISWLSEFADKSTFQKFCKENGITGIKTSFIEQIDHENLSGISNPYLTNAKEALILVEKVATVFKSEKFNYFQTFIKESDQPLTDYRVFIKERQVNFPLEFHQGFTVKQFYEMKGITESTDKIIVNLVLDDYSSGQHEIKPGNEVELILKTKNYYTENRSKIDTSLKFLNEAALRNSYVQLITV